MYLSNAKFGAQLSLEAVRITGDLDMSGASFSGASIGGAGLDLFGAKIERSLWLSDATAWQIDLSDADVALLQLRGLKWWCAGAKTLGRPASGSPNKRQIKTADQKSDPIELPLGVDAWKSVTCDGNDPDAYPDTLPALILVNTHVGTLQDGPYAWPPVIKLQGFHYDRLGDLVFGGRNDISARAPEKWADWLARNRSFNEQPYMELSSVLAAAGQRDTADAVLFAGRERERLADWADHRFFKYAWLTFLSYVAGYGIGLYTFLVLLWVAGITVLGADILWYSLNARRHRYYWRLGASLHRLLPIIELSKEFTDFFDNPLPQFDEEPNLSRWQVAYFAVHAVAGWVLGFFLIAAMGGIIQKS